MALVPRDSSSDQQGPGVETAADWRTDDVTVAFCTPGVRRQVPRPAVPPAVPRRAPKERGVGDVHWTPALCPRGFSYLPYLIFTATLLKLGVITVLQAKTEPHKD